MQKVEGSSPFSRLQKPRNCWVFSWCDSRAVRLSCCRRSRVRSPVGRGSNTPYLLEFQHRKRSWSRADGQLCESVPDSFRNLKRGAGWRRHAHRGSITPQATSRTSLERSPTGIDEPLSPEPHSSRVETALRAPAFRARQMRRAAGREEDDVHLSDPTF
jgi:hypothetical protein